MAGQRLVVGTCVLADANTNLIALTFSTGFSGGATAGYLKARGGNAAAIYVGEDNDLSGEPRLRLAAGETCPVRIEYEKVITLYCKGTQNDVLEFIAQASE